MEKAIWHQVKMQYMRFMTLLELKKFFYLKYRIS